MADYKEMTDDELIVLAQSGDSDALETVLVRYQPLVYKKSRPYYLAGGDDDVAPIHVDQFPEIVGFA